MSKVEFILDESAMLGQMDAIDNAVGIGRGYGIRLYFFFQSFGQLHKCFPEGQEQTLLSNVSQIFMAVNDNATADYVSTRLGEETIILESGGTSRGDSYSASHGSQASYSHGNSSNRNDGWNQQARRLLKPEEVIALPPRVALTFTAAVPPIWTNTIRSYEEKNLPALVRSQKGLLRSTTRLVAAAFCFTIASLIAVVMTLALQNDLKKIFADGGWRQSNYREQGVNNVTTGKRAIRRFEGGGTERGQYPGQ